MKKLFFLFVIVWSIQVFAQPKLKWSHDKGYSSISDLFYSGENTSHVFVKHLTRPPFQSIGVEGLVFERSSMGIKAKIPLAGKEVESQTISGDNPFWLSVGLINFENDLYAYRNGSIGEMKCIFLDKIDPETFQRTGNSITVNKIDVGSFSGLLKGMFGFSEPYAIQASSEDGAYQAIYSAINTHSPSTRAGDSKSYAQAVTLFDRSGKIMWTKLFKLEEQDYYTFISKIEVSNQGDVFMFGRSSMSASGKYEPKSLRIRYEVEIPNILHKISATDDSPVKIDLSSSQEDGLDPISFCIKRANDRFYVASFTGKKSLKQKKVSGFDFRTYDLKMNLIAERFVPTEGSFFKASISKSEQKSIDKGKLIKTGTPLIMHMKVTNDECQMVFQEYRKKQKGDNWMTLFEDITVFSMDLTGKEKWRTNIHTMIRMIYSQAPGGCFVQDSENGLNIMFNDATKFEKMMIFSEGSYSGLETMVVHVNQLGKIETSISIPTVGSSINPLKCAQLSPTEFLLLGTSDGSWTIGLGTLDK